MQVSNEDDVAKPETAAAPKTPSKERCSLGAPSAYYFNDILSTAKKRRTDTSMIMGGNHTGELSVASVKMALDNETSLLSIGDSSSGSEDLLNKSTLSDTTELTASNFVLAATSRQKFRNLSKSQPNAEPKMASKLKPDEKNAIPPSNKTATYDDDPSTIDSNEKENQGRHGSKWHCSREGSKLASQHNSQPLSSRSEETSEVLATKGSPEQRVSSIRDASPSLRSRISASPHSLRQFTESLKKRRIERRMQREEDAKRRLSSGNDTGCFSISAALDTAEPKSLKRKLLPPSMTQPSPYSENFMKEFMSSPSGDRLSLDTSKLSTADSSHDLHGAANETKDNNIVKRNRSSDFNTEESIGRTAGNFSTKEPPLGQEWESSSEISSVRPNEKSSHFLSSPGRNRLDEEGVPLDIEFPEPTKNDDPHANQERESQSSSLSVASPRHTNHATLLLTKGSNSKLTPSKLQSPARRILNPRLIDSPARNTRSAKKKRKDDSESTGNMSVNFGISLLNTSIAENSASPSSEPSLSQPKPAELFKSPQRNENFSANEARKDDVVSNGHLNSSDSSSMSMVVQSKTPESNLNLSHDSIASIEKGFLNSDKKKRLSEGDTASVGDIADILRLNKETQHTGGSSRLLHTVGDTASIGDIADIMNTGREAKGTSSLSKPDYTPTSFLGGNRNRQSIGDTASLGDIADILNKEREEIATNSAPSRKDYTPTSFSGDNSNRQSMGDTASIGDIADILNQGREEIAASSSSNHTDYTSPSISGDHSNRQSMGNTASIGDIADILHQGSKRLSTSESSRADYSLPSFSRNQSDRRSTGDTASIGDIADILHQGSKRLSTSESSRADYSPPSFSWNQSDRQSTGDTASIGDIADILNQDRKRLSTSESSGADYSPPSFSGNQSGRQSIGDTASIGDIADILNLGKETSSNGGSSKQDHMLSPSGSISDTPTPKYGKDATADSDERCFVDSEGSKNKRRGSTSSLGDIADILGSESRTSRTSPSRPFLGSTPVQRFGGRSEIRNGTEDSKASSAEFDMDEENGPLGLASFPKTGSEVENSNTSQKRLAASQNATEAVAVDRHLLSDSETSRNISTDTTASADDIADILNMNRGLKVNVQEKPRIPSSTLEHTYDEETNNQKLAVMDISQAKSGTGEKHLLGPERRNNENRDSTESIGDIADVLAIARGTNSSKSASLPLPVSPQNTYKIEKMNILTSQSPTDSVQSRFVGLEQNKSEITDETASIGDIADILGKKTPSSSPTKPGKEPLNIQKKESSVSRSRTPAGLGSSVLDITQKGNESEGDTASVGDIADILGGIVRRTEISSNDTKASTADPSLNQDSIPAQESGDTASLGDAIGILDLSSSSQKASDENIMPSFIGPNRAQSPTTEGQIENSFSRANTMNGSDSPVTASIGDIADILGSGADHGASGGSPKNLTPMQLDGSSKDQIGKSFDSTEMNSLLRSDDSVQDIQETSRNSLANSSGSTDQVSNLSEHTTLNVESVEENDNVLGTGISRSNGASAPLGATSLFPQESTPQGEQSNTSRKADPGSFASADNGSSNTKSIESSKNMTNYEERLDSWNSIQTDLSDRDVSKGALSNLLNISASEEQSSCKSDTYESITTNDKAGGNEGEKGALLDTLNSTPRRKQHHKSPMRLVPNNHLKPTPTKLEPSPRRIPNPKRVDSPARNTRSSKRRKQSELFKSPHTFELKSDQKEAPAAIREKKEAGRFQKENLTPGMKPVGILSSKKASRYNGSNTGNRSFSQRSVIFGSPEAAEYHIHSPSVSLTPMPSSKVRALFSVPRGENLSNDESETTTSSIMGTSVEQTVEIEDDINVLVDKISAQNMHGSPALSPIANVDDNDDPNSAPYKTRDNSIESSQSSDETSFRDGMTVELEAGMDRLLENAIGSSKSSKKTTSLEGMVEEKPGDGLDESIPASEGKERDSIRTSLVRIEAPLTQQSMSQDETLHEYSPNESIEMTDARSIATLNSRSENITSELPIHGQKLDFSPASTRSDVSDVHDEGCTMELENDMTSLLTAVGVAERMESTRADTAVQSGGQEPYSKDVVRQNRLSSIQDSPNGSFSSESSSSPLLLTGSSRKSISSRRFTLSPLSKSEDFTSDEENHEESQGRLLSHLGGNHEVENGSEEARPQNEAVDLTFQELSGLAGLGPSETNIDARPADDSEDALVYLKRITITANLDPFTFKSLRRLLTAVCVEIEKQIPADGVPSTIFSEGVEDDPEKFLKLQRIVRKEGDSGVKHDLRVLAERGKLTSHSEWKQWMATVLESFHVPLLGIHSTRGLVADDVNSASIKFSEYHELLSFISNKKIRRARRKSFNRRKSTASALEDQIRSMQNDVDNLKSMLSEASNSERITEERRNDLLLSISLGKECRDLRSEVESSKKSYHSLLGVQSFNPTLISESRWCFVSNGKSENSENHLVYHIESNDSINSIVSSRSGVSSKKYRCNKSISAYLDACIQLHARNTQAGKAPTAVSRIPPHMQTYFWKVGRLDVTSRELQVMLKRFNAKLYFSAKNGFTMSVDFENERTKLVANFGVSLEYPSLPLEVDLHLLRGEMDLDKLHISLRKNAKPGFGNFLRTCDLINAYCGLNPVLR